MLVEYALLGMCIVRGVASYVAFSDALHELPHDFLLEAHVEREEIVEVVAVCVKY